MLNVHTFTWNCKWLGEKKSGQTEDGEEKREIHTLTSDNILTPWPNTRMAEYSNTRTNGKQKSKARSRRREKNKTRWPTNDFEQQNGNLNCSIMIIANKKKSIFTANDEKNSWTNSGNKLQNPIEYTWSFRILHTHTHTTGTDHAKTWLS